ncbi:MAG TPA: hypothetical protein VFL99_13385 [Segeticoccus sp.]|uniref:hypothetical protein n=1 Tax=Segeticoccus sp. TaxID=2706531 RepID=UPI002D80067C|nr:hypothetical protein [Segeticoccus sp.]HET8601316.1 hypothetical protein [Segeticoccus sp.]
MTLLHDLTKDLTKDLSGFTKALRDARPVYAAVGATDLAVAQVRKARTRAEQLRAELTREDLRRRADELAGQAQQVPNEALSRTALAAGQAQDTYADLARRGQELVARLRRQQSTKDLFAHADTVIAQGKGAVTTVRRAVGDTEQEVQRDVKRTATTARKRTANTKRATRATATSTRKTATAAKKAGKDAAGKVGD